MELISELFSLSTDKKRLSAHRAVLAVGVSQTVIGTTAHDFMSLAWTATDWKLADTMSSYWVNFATRGDPNGPGLPVWPVYDEGDQQIMNFGDPIRALAMPRTPELKFWDKINHTEFAAPTVRGH